MREKLMALIDESDKICDSYFRCDECPYRAEYGRNCINELITDHLIAQRITGLDPRKFYDIIKLVEMAKKELADG